MHFCSRQRGPWSEATMTELTDRARAFLAGKAPPFKEANKR
jgi:hypothetical protein